MSRNKEDDIPVIMPIKKPDFDKPMAKCGICGFVIKPYEAIGYVCGNTDCPIFPKVTC